MRLKLKAILRGMTRDASCAGPSAGAVVGEEAKDSRLSKHRVVMKMKPFSKRRPIRLHHKQETGCL